MLAGKLTDFSIDDVFQLLTLTRKTGALRVQVPGAGGSDGFEARVHFIGGAVCLATADVGRVEIGEKLVAGGHISQDDVDALCAEDPSGEGLALISRILERELLDGSVLDAHVREAVHDAAALLVGLPDGSFTFDADLAVSGWSGPTFAADEVLAEGRRRVEERASVVGRLPSTDAALALRPELPEDRTEVTFDRLQWQLVALLDGTRSAKQIAGAVEQEELATYALLADFLDAGLVEVGEVRDDVADAPPPAPEADQVTAFDESAESGQAPEPELVPEVEVGIAAQDEGAPEPAPEQPAEAEQADEPQYEEAATESAAESALESWDAPEPLFGPEPESAPDSEPISELESTPEPVAELEADPLGEATVETEAEGERETSAVEPTWSPESGRASDLVDAPTGSDDDGGSAPAPVDEPEAGAREGSGDERAEAAQLVPVPTPVAIAADEQPGAQPAAGPSSDDHLEPQLSRRDVTVDRYVMARELSSLGLGFEAPLRRSVARPAARPAPVPEPAPAEAPAVNHEPVRPTATTAVEHKLERDTRLNRGLLMRLIDGVRGI